MCFSDDPGEGIHVHDCTYNWAPDVNKAFLSLAAGVLFAVFSTGLLVGRQVGGLTDDAPGPEANGTS